MGQIKRLFRFEQGSFLLMMAAVLLALLASNSPLSSIYDMVHHLPVHLRFGPLVIDEPLANWINEGLMVIFFLLVGLEIKRQYLEGHLSSAKCAALPAFAALGGMLVPAAIYVALNWHDPIALRGWAIPTATDIVLVLGILSVFGDRIPASLRVFLTALAIFDDIGAVIIIALFYGAAPNSAAITTAAIAITGLLLINRFRLTHPMGYVVFGAVLWAAMNQAGLEAALTGFLVALAIPLHTPGCSCSSPLRKTERLLHPWNVLFIVPLFAFFNAGVSFELSADYWSDASVPLGIVAGLFVGKQVGIFIATRLAVFVGLADLPKGMSWPQLYGAGVLAGVGFTVSTFITTIAFTDAGLASLSKLSILLGSLVSAIAGAIVITHSTTGERARPDAGAIASREA